MLTNELEQAVRMARGAGKILMEIYATDFEVEYKGENDPLTEADRRANEYLVTELRKAFPSDGVVAEETADRSDALASGRCWYVDPVDGTKEFVAKNGEFSVMLGLAIDGESKLGVVYQPAKDKLYKGIVGQGAWLETAEGIRDLTVSTAADPAALNLVVSRSHRSKSTDMLVKALGIEKETASGSVGLKVGLIAEQAADLYVHISDKSWAWDACGPEAILRGAGGRFTRLDGEPYRYGGDELRNVGGILACNAAAFERVLPAAREVAEKTGLIGS